MFAGSLRTLLERPDALDRVLQHRTVDGALSGTYEALVDIIDRILDSAPEIINDAVSRKRGASSPAGAGEEEIEEEREEERPKGKQKPVLDLEDGMELVKSSGMSWKDACDRRLCKLESRFGGKRELRQMEAVQLAVKYILEGFDLADMESVNWHDMFSQSTAFTQTFQTSVQEIFQRRGLRGDLVAIDYSSLRTMSSIEDQDTLLVFFKRLILLILLLDLTVDHLISPANVCGEKGEVCSPDFESVMAVRFGFSGTGATYSSAVELRSMIKLLNMYMKWGPIVLLVRLFRFKYYRTSNYINSIDQPLTRLWAQVLDDYQARKILKQKKKAASKILLRFIHIFGGEGTVVAIRSILTRLDGFSVAYQPPLLKSANSLPTSNPAIDT